MATLRPCAFSAASSRDGKDCSGLTPRPAAKLSPRTTILTGAVCANAGAKLNASSTSSELNAAAKRPYPVLRLMAVTAPPSIVRFADVHLDMASDAGTVNILRGISLDIAAGGNAPVGGAPGAGRAGLMVVGGGPGGGPPRRGGGGGRGWGGGGRPRLGSAGR